MDRTKMTIREKLQLIKEIDQRNEERRKEFVEKEKRNKKLFDMYVHGEISEEDFFRLYKK